MCSAENDVQLLRFLLKAVSDKLAVYMGEAGVWAYTNSAKAHYEQAEGVSHG